MATKVTFIWEETPEMSYDEMFDRLMFLGAEDVETEEFERPEEPKVERQRKPLPAQSQKKSVHPGEGIAHPGTP